MIRETRQCWYFDAGEWFFDYPAIAFKPTVARRMGLNPINHEEPVVVYGKELIEETFATVQCCNCSDYDFNNSSSEEASIKSHNGEVEYGVINGNSHIEYPKNSWQFWCPLCFIWNHDRKTVNRILGTDPTLPHHNEPAADEPEKRIQMYGE
jgi:hypothetical protein